MRAAAVDRRVEAVAGPPTAWRTSVGSISTGMDPLQPRTLIAVAGAGALGGVARFGPVATGISRLGVQVDSNLAFATGYMRPDESLQQINVPASRPLVAAIQIGTDIVLDVRGSRARKIGFVWGDGFTDDQLLVQSTACLYAAAWPRVLTNAEVREISQRLAQRYGIPL